MKVIWKYPFRVQDEVIIEMPEYAKPLHVECQGEHACLWALVDPEARQVPLSFRVFGTGHPIFFAEALSYVGTFRQPPFVWHVFQMPRYDGPPPA